MEDMLDIKIELLKSKVRMLMTEKEAQEEYATELEKVLLERDKEIEKLKNN